MILLLACAGAEGDTAGLVVDDNTVAYEAGDCSREPPLTYENFGQLFFTRYCTSCHSSALAGEDRSEAPPDKNFDTYENIAAFAGLIEMVTVGEEASMPPGGGPTETEQALLQEWFTCSVY